MKINTYPGLGVIALVGIITTGAATAATHSSKGGMLTTTEHSHHQSIGSGLPMLAPGVQELGLSGHLNWEDSTSYSFDISYGRFYTENWLFGVQAGITGLNSDKDYRAGVFGEYNFLTGTKWVTFIRSNIGRLNDGCEETSRLANESSVFRSGVSRQQFDDEKLLMHFGQFRNGQFGSSGHAAEFVEQLEIRPRFLFELFSQCRFVKPEE